MNNNDNLEIRRVLIVDDEPDLRDALSRLIKEENIETQTAENGLAALELLRTQNFHAVLCDIKMPEMNGLDCLAQAQSEEIITPFVFVTGYGDADRMLQAIRLGAVDFINKPFDNNEITEVMFRVLEIGTRRRKIFREIEKESSHLLENVRREERMISFIRLSNNIKRRGGGN